MNWKTVQWTVFQEGTPCKWRRSLKKMGFIDKLCSIGIFTYWAFLFSTILMQKLTPHVMCGAIFFCGNSRWWRRGELNPCPKAHSCNFLRAYFTYYDSRGWPPINGLRAEVVRIQLTDTDTSDSRSPLIDAQARAAVLPRWTEADLSSYQWSICRYCNVISCVYI